MARLRCQPLLCLALLLVAVLQLPPPPPRASLPGTHAAAVFLNGPACTTEQPLRLSNVFSGSSPVLSCAPSHARLWGYASPGCTITVRLAGQPLAAALAYDGSGRFTATLPPQPCGTAPAALSLHSSSGQNLTLAPRFGHVLLCSGQSNAVGLSTLPGFEADSSVAASLTFEPPAVGAAAAAPMPLYGLRVGMLDSWALDAPLEELASPPELPWSPLPTAAAAQPFSALCWWWGRALAARTNSSAAIGLIEAAWGGSWLQAWSSPTALAACAAPPFGMAWAPGHFSSLRNSMLAPFAAGPMALTAVAWYNGESNALVGQQAYYACGLKHLVGDLRALFASASLPVSIIELAPFGRNVGSWGGGWVGVRAAQLAVALELALGAHAPGHVTLVPTSDCRDPAGDIHPRCKRVMGERLGESLAGELAGSSSAGAWRGGPAYSHSALQPGGAVVIVRFWGGPVAWVQDEGACEGVDWEACRDGGAQVQVAGGAWVAAEGSVVEGGGGIALRAAAGGGAAGLPITGSRYGRGMWPAVSIVSAAGGWPCHPWEEAVQQGSS